jgi:hypothetical protein
MAVFLFVTASMTVLAGLVALVTGHVPRRTGHSREQRVFPPHSLTDAERVMGYQISKATR